MNLEEAERALREALEFYADPSTYEEGGDGGPSFYGGLVPINADDGSIARAALAAAAAPSGPHEPESNDWHDLRAEILSVPEVAAEYDKIAERPIDFDARYAIYLQEARECRRLQADGLAMSIDPGDMLYLLSLVGAAPSGEPTMLDYNARFHEDHETDILIEEFAAGSGAPSGPDEQVIADSECENPQECNARPGRCPRGCGEPRDWLGEALESLRSAAIMSPAESESRDTFADGFTNGLWAAHGLVAAHEASRRASGEPPSAAALYGRAQDTTWPIPGETEWNLRYAPDAVNRLHAASIVSAYSHLVDPNLTQKDAVAALKRARAAMGPSGEPPSEQEQEVTAKVLVDRSSSKCSACGGNADYNETHHIHGGPHSMWDAGSALTETNGCGARFVERVDLYGTPSGERDAGPQEGKA